MNRYTRQTMLPEIGEEGQKALSNARVLVVGVGGLGSPIALYLAGAGVGHLGLIDDDVVSESNLQRQVLYSEKELGKPKVIVAKEKLENLNSSINICIYEERLTAENAESIISNYDIVVDGCDNFRTRHIIDCMCAKLSKIYVYGAITAFEGQVSVFNYKDGPTYRDLFPDDELVKQPEQLQVNGVVGVTPGLVGCIEANEVLKIICGYGEVMSGKLLLLDLKTMKTTIIDL